MITQIASKKEEKIQNNKKVNRRACGISFEQKIDVKVSNTSLKILFFIMFPFE